MPKKTHLSASALQAFKSCPMRYHGAYDLGIRKIEDTEALRIGTNYHAIQEIMGMVPGSECPSAPCHVFDGHGEPCPLCNNTNTLPDNMIDAVVRFLNQCYGDLPPHIDKEAMEIERIKLLYTLTGYNWHYQNDDLEVIATEIPFEISVINPETGRALPNVINKGKIDKLIRLDGLIYVLDHKSTSNSVDPDSRIWKKLNLDTQMNNYVYAARRLHAMGELEQYGIMGGDLAIAGAYYDCWHKPGISPKKLSQADSKKFVETGQYCDQKFDFRWDDLGMTGKESQPVINNVVAIMEPGKKEGTFAIRETPEMYGARLLADIVERPGFYFGRRELTKTDPQMERFEWELYNIYQTIKDMKRTGHWYGDESQCEATFTCDFVPFCYENKPISVEEMPEGFHCIFNKGETNVNDNTTTPGSEATAAS